MPKRSVDLCDVEDEPHARRSDPEAGAIRGGYAPRSAEVTASKLLRNAKVAQAVAAGTAAQLRKAELTAASVLEAIRRQVDGDIRRLYDEQGNLIPIKSLTAEDAALIAGFEVVIKNAAAGGHTDTIHKVRLKEQAKFVELAAKYLWLLEERVAVTHVDKLLARLDEGRARNAAASAAAKKAHASGQRE